MASGERAASDYNGVDMRLVQVVRDGERRVGVVADESVRLLRHRTVVEAIEEGLSFDSTETILSDEVYSGESDFGKFCGSTSPFVNKKTPRATAFFFKILSIVENQKPRRISRGS